MKTFAAIALTMVLTAATLVGCGCTNQKMDSTPTVLPTNEEIWNSTEATTRHTTESTILTETTSETTDTTRGINETEVQNHVNAHTEMMDKIRGKENATTATDGSAGTNARRMVPGTR